MTKAKVKNHFLKRIKAAQKELKKYPPEYINQLRTYINCRPPHGYKPTAIERCEDCAGDGDYSYWPG